METRKQVVLLLKCEIRQTPGDHQDHFCTFTLKYLVTFPSGVTWAAGLQRITPSTAANRTRSLVENRESGSNWSMCQITLIDSFITQQLRRAAALWVSVSWETAGGFFILRLRMKTWLSVSRWLTVRHRVYMEVNSAGNKTPPAAAAGTTGLWSKDKTHLLILRPSPSRWRTRRAPCLKFYVQQLKNREKEINGGKNQDPAGVCVCVCVCVCEASSGRDVSSSLLSPLSPLLLSEELRVVFWSTGGIKIGLSVHLDALAPPPPPLSLSLSLSLSPLLRSVPPSLSPSLSLIADEQKECVVPLSPPACLSVCLSEYKSTCGGFPRTHDLAHGASRCEVCRRLSMRADIHTVHTN